MEKSLYSRFVNVVLISLILVSSIPAVSSQILDKKLHLFVGLGSGDIAGESWINRDGLIVPGLLGNYNQFNNQSFSATYKINSWSSAGLGIMFQEASLWELENASLFANSETTTRMVMPLVRLHTPIQRQGVLNRMQFYLEVAGGGGNMNTDFGYPMVRAVPVTRRHDDLTSESSVIYGAKASIGSMLFINQRLGIYASYSHVRYNFNGSMILENTFSGSFFELGLNARFLNRKDYYR